MFDALGITARLLGEERARKRAAMAEARAQLRAAREIMPRARRLYDRALLWLIDGEAGLWRTASAAHHVGQRVRAYAGEPAGGSVRLFVRARDAERALTAAGWRAPEVSD